jgi:hypothetical protein
MEFFVFEMLHCFNEKDEQQRVLELDSKQTAVRLETGKIFLPKLTASSSSGSCKVLFSNIVGIRFGFYFTTP